MRGLGRIAICACIAVIVLFAIACGEMLALILTPDARAMCASVWTYGQAKELLNNKKHPACQLDADLDGRPCEDQFPLQAAADTLAITPYACHLPAALRF